LIISSSVKEKENPSSKYLCLLSTNINISLRKRKKIAQDLGLLRGQIELKEEIPKRGNI